MSGEHHFRDQVVAVSQGRLSKPFVESLAREVGTERLLWVGRPRLGELLLTMFSLGVGVLVVGGLTFFSKAVDSRFFGCLGVLLGNGILAHSGLTAWRVRRTVYAVTEKRLLIVQIGRVVKVFSFTPGQIVRLEKQVQSSGRGNLLFAGDNSENTIGFRRDGFYGIDNVVEVERLIRESLLGQPPRAN